VNKAAGQGMMLSFIHTRTKMPLLLLLIVLANENDSVALQNSARCLKVAVSFPVRLSQGLEDVIT
jgi:hypothetical protein